VGHFETHVDCIKVDDTEHVLANRSIVLTDSDSCQQLQIGITLVPSCYQSCMFQLHIEIMLVPSGYQPCMFQFHIGIR